MIYVLLEDSYNVINPVEPSLTKKFHSMSVKRIGETVSNVLIDTVSSPPLLDARWLIIVSSMKAVKSVSKLSPEMNVIVIYARSIGDLESISDALGILEYRLINNLKIEPMTVRFWIEAKLKCEPRLSKYLYTRLGGQLRYLVPAVQQLEHIPDITMKVMRELTNKVDGVTVFDVVRYLLGLGKRSYKDVAQWLYDFRSSGRWLKKSLISELEKYLEVFGYMVDGQLSLTNYREFKGVCDSKSIRDLKDWQLKVIIESHGVVSAEYVYYLLIQLRGMDTSQFSAVRIMNLVKMGGNNVRSM